MAGGNDSGGNGGEKTYFEQQREMLVGEVAQNLEAVLQNINKLNRSLEGIIAVSPAHGSSISVLVETNYFFCLFFVLFCFVLAPSGFSNHKMSFRCHDTSS